MPRDNLTSTPADAPLRVGVSSCLLGHEVRYDGRHKRDPFLTETLARFVEWVPVCPEVEAGMPIPRPAVRMVEGAGRVGMHEVGSGHDHTRRMTAYAAKRVAALRRVGLHGFIFKAKSPSCGLARVPIAIARRRPRKGRGLFAAALTDACPLLPAVEESRLHDPRLCAHFVERVFAYRRLRALFRDRPGRLRLSNFHMRHKLQLMAHSRAAEGVLDRLVARFDEVPFREFRREYESRFMQALGRVSTAAQGASVLRYAAGFVEERLDPPTRRKLERLIAGYEREQVALVDVITPLCGHVDRFEIADLAGQTWLEPHPDEVALRDRI